MKNKYSVRCRLSIRFMSPHAMLPDTCYFTKEPIHGINR